MSDRADYVLQMQEKLLAGTVRFDPATEETKLILPSVFVSKIDQWHQWKICGTTPEG
ncbi:MAG: hypothetical protein ACUVR8_12040 [Acidobacteriota bacterium]